MSGSQSVAATAAPQPVAEVNLLDQVLSATRQTEPDRAQDLVKTLVEQALNGTVTFDRNLTRTIAGAIEAIDRKLSDRVNAIMHHEKFLKLEGSWRGLHYLVQNSETSTTLKIRLLNATKAELNKDLTKAVEFDQSQRFKKIYENEFGTPGGLRTLPVGGGCRSFGFRDWTELPHTRDLAKIFDAVEYTSWRSFRDSEDSRFVSLIMPRVLARLPFGAATKQIDEFAFEEAPFDEAGAPRQMRHRDYCWMNAAFVMGARMTDAFAKYGFCTMIRGAARLAVPPDQRTTLARGVIAGRFDRLGIDAAIGVRAWDAQARLVLVIGPLDLAAFEALLPDRPALRRLVSLVRAFLGFETGFAVNPVLAAAAVPPLRLAEARLGWNTWLPTATPRRRPGDEAVFEAELAE